MHGSIRVLRTWLLLRGTKRDVGGRMLAYATFNATSFIAAVSSGPYDVIITPSPPLTIGICGWLLARLWGARFIYNVQDIYPDAAIKLGLLRNPIVIKFFQRLETFVYSRADAITVLSEDFRSNLLAKRVSREKVVVIPNGVDTSFIRPLPRDNPFARAHGMIGRFVVLYAGNVGLAQGLETLIDAAVLLRDIADVWIVGSGAGHDTVKARAAEATNVHFMPFQTREQVPLLYASADICIVMLRPGLGDSSVPSKLYTIMAAGRTVLAAVDPGTEAWRLVVSAGCGVCVPPGDAHGLATAVSELQIARDRLDAYGSRGREYVEKYNARRIVGLHYQKLMNGLIDRRTVEKGR
jgi:colanic acid biosynthesis glycosyl transferase WcaI